MAIRTASGVYLTPVGSAPLTLLSTWSVGAWARADASMVSLNGVLVSQYASNDANMFLGISYNDNGLAPAGRWFVGNYDTSVDDWDFAMDNASHEIGQWVHIAGTFDGTTLTFYKNGRRMSTGAVVGFGTTSTILRIGMRSSNTTDYFNGLIQDCWMYNMALTPDEMMRLAQGYLPMQVRPNALVGWWPLNDNANGTRKDLSKSQYHAIEVGGSVGYEPGPIFHESLDGGVVGAEVSALGISEGIDEATVRLTLTPSATEIVDVTDLADVYLDMTPSMVEVYTRHDAATVYLNLSNLGGECYSTYSAQLLGEGEADTRWYHSDDQERWTDEDELRWDEGDVTLGEGIHC